MAVLPVQACQTKNPNYFFVTKRFRQDIVSSQIQGFRPKGFISKPGSNYQERRIRQHDYFT